MTWRNWYVTLDPRFGIDDSDCSADRHQKLRRLHRALLRAHPSCFGKFGNSSFGANQGGRDRGRFALNSRTSPASLVPSRRACPQAALEGGWRPPATRSASNGLKVCWHGGQFSAAARACPRQLEHYGKVKQLSGVPIAIACFDPVRPIVPAATKNFLQAHSPVHPKTYLEHVAGQVDHRYH